MARTTLLEYALPPLMRFRFLDPGPLIDGELELIEPHARWIEQLLATCSHPKSINDPAAQATTRVRVMDFLNAAPRGRQPGDARRGLAPSYHFWMRLLSSAESPPIVIAGGITLRIGKMVDLERYCGHIGYGVYPPARGRHYAERAARLLLPLARQHGMDRLWITANPENAASRRTCERLGCTFVDVVDVPGDHPLHQRGEVRKCRYFIDL